VLVRFDIASLNQELAALQLDVLEAQSRLDRAQADLTRQTSLFERGITSRNAYDTSRLEQSAAESALAGARDRLEVVRSGQSRNVVRATFAGVVANVWRAEGDAVRPDAADPIIRVIDPTRVQVAVQLPVLQLARVAVGQVATVRAIAGAADEPATVVSRVQSADPSAPTGEVRLGFSNPATLALETPVSVEILLERRLDAVLVPAQAIGRDDTGTFVMVAGSGGLAHRRDVRLGLITPQLVQVSSGLTDGEQVVVSQLGELADQASIVISR
jgi:RND family efflux transporter MFP subunit